jgi:hypothetical protein
VLFTTQSDSVPYGFGVVCFDTLRGDWLETMLKAAEKRGIDTTALLDVTKTEDAEGWRIDGNQLDELLRREVGWSGGS